MVKSDFRVRSNSEVLSTLKQRECNREMWDEPAPVNEPSLNHSELRLPTCQQTLSALYQEQPKLVSLNRAL